MLVPDIRSQSLGFLRLFKARGTTRKPAAALEAIDCEPGRCGLVSARLLCLGEISLDERLGPNLRHVLGGLLVIL